MADLWTLIVRRRDAFLVPFLVVLTAGIWLMVRQPKVYEAEVILRYESALDADAAAAERARANVLFSAQSPETLGAVMQRLGLKGLPADFLPGLTAGWEQEATRLRVVLQGTDPDPLPKVLGGLAAHLVESSGSGADRRTEGVLRGVRNQREEQESRLKALLTEIRDMQNAEQVDSIASERDRCKARNEELELKIGERLTEEQSLKRTLAGSRADGGRSDAASSREQDELMALLRKELIDLELEHLRLQPIYLEGHPRLVELREARRFLEERIKSLTSHRPEKPEPRKNLRRAGIPGEERWQLEMRLALLGAETQFLRDKLLEGKKRYQRLVEVDGQLSDKLRETRLLEQTLGSLLVREQALVAESVRAGGKLMVVKSPIRPLLPASPDVRKYGAMTILLALFFGLSMVFLAEQADRTFSLPEDVAAALNLPGRGAIPDLDRVMIMGAGRPEMLDPVLCVHMAPGECEAEAFRLLRTNLLHSHRQNPFQTLMILAPTPGCGATSVAANLGVALAQNNHSVLLVDADLRCPAVHKLFRLDNTVGLVNLLTGLDVRKVVRDTPIKGLRIIGTGPLPPHPADLLQHDALEELLRVLKSEADFIIVNGPTLGRFSDGLILAPLVDRIFYLVGIGFTEKREAQTGIDWLRGIDCRYVDLICNRIPPAENCGT